MKEREAAAMTASGLCLSVAILRMLAPALPFDWMTLVLVALAALLIAVPRCFARPQAQAAAPAQRTDAAPQSAPFIPKDMDTLRMRMAQTGWEAGKGGLFDSLRALHEDKPFAALSAARGMIMMLEKQASPADKETFTLLCAALDETAQAGEAAADPGTVDALFSYAMRTLGYLDHSDH